MRVLGVVLLGLGCLMLVGVGGLLFEPPDELVSMDEKGRPVGLARGLVCENSHLRLVGMAGLPSSRPGTETVESERLARSACATLAMEEMPFFPAFVVLAYLALHFGARLGSRKDAVPAAATYAPAAETYAQAAGVKETSKLKPSWRRRSVLLGGGTALVVVGIVVFAVSRFPINDALYRRGVTTSGEIVKVQKETASEWPLTVVRYRTPLEETFRLEVEAEPSFMPPTKQLQVTYDAAFPSDARLGPPPDRDKVVKSWLLYRVSQILMLAGIVVGAISFLEDPVPVPGPLDHEWV